MQDGTVNFEFTPVDSRLNKKKINYSPSPIKNKLAVQKAAFELSPFICRNNINSSNTAVVHEIH